MATLVTAVDGIAWAGKTIAVDEKRGRCDGSKIVVMPEQNDDKLFNSGEQTGVRLHYVFCSRRRDRRVLMMPTFDEIMLLYDTDKTRRASATVGI